MKTPHFWQSHNILSTLLLPASVLYGMGRRIDQATATPVTLPVPVICIGNLTAGGAGKTPVALHIGRKLKEKGIKACFLSRGYGGTLPGPLPVDLARHSAADVGDEPLLLARLLPTAVAKDRVQGGRFAVEHGAEVIIMDDGFQNPWLVKTLSLVVVDGQAGFGNGRLLPAGPLREPVAEGLKRAQAVVVLNRGEAMPALPTGKPVLFARTQAENAASLKGKKLLAFCGIAHPQKFFAMLQAQGAQLVETFSFPDHYPYTESGLKQLADTAAQHGAVLATTAKDAVRLPASWTSKVTVIGMMLAFDNEALLDSLITSVLQAYGKA